METKKRKQTAASIPVLLFLTALFMTLFFCCNSVAAQPSMQEKPRETKALTRLTITTAPADSNIRILSPQVMPFVNGMNLPQGEEYLLEIQHKGYNPIWDTVYLDKDLLSLKYVLYKKEVLDKIPPIPTVDPKKRQQMLRLAKAMDLSVTPHQIDNLLKSRRCGIISSENEAVDGEILLVSFSPDAVLAIDSRRDSLLQIITPKRELPINNALIVGCEEDKGEPVCVELIGDIIPCN